MTAWTDRDVKAFAAAHLRADRGSLATFARWNYQTNGRGLVAITVRGEPPQDVVSALALKIGYRPLADYQARTTAAPAALRLRMAETVRAIQTYDPATEMVIAFVCGRKYLTLSGVVSLEAPAAVEADRVH